jgi:hypothetical protein
MRHYTNLQNLILIAGLWLAVTSASHAEVVLVPADLAPGDPYRLVFVTSGNFGEGPSNDIAAYNAFVDGFGETLIAGHDWRAIASTNTVDARDNTSTVPGADDPDGIPIYRLDGLRVAASYAALWGTAVTPLLNPVRLTELGTPSTAEAIWTGTNAAGFKLVLNAVGESNQTDSQWIFFATSGLFASRPLYAISQVLEAPVPLPAPLGLLAVTTVLVMARGRRRGTTDPGRATHPGAK